MIARARKGMLAALGLGTLVACATSVGPNGAPPAHPQQRIEALLRRDVPLVVRPRDIRTQSAMRRALSAAGLVAAKAFTRAALRQSVPCDVYDPAERGSRCFTIARREFVDLTGPAAVENTTLDRSGAFVFTFRFRAVPISSLGRQLATSRVLECANARRGAEVWHGRDTIAYGSYSVSFPGDGPQAESVIADCPIDPLLGESSLIF